MPTITVNDLEFAIKNHKKFDVVISLLDVDVCPEACFGERKTSHLVKQFDDYDDGKFATAPKAEDVQNILSFARKHIKEDSKVLVHCHAGISRSTAIAIGLLIDRNGWHPRHAIGEIHRQRGHIMWPNKLIIKHLDKLLDQHGQLRMQFKRWRRSQSRLGSNNFIFLPPKETENFED